MKFTKIDEATQTLCSRIGVAKAEYLSAKARLNAARGFYGQAMFQWKKADRILRLRPASKGGDQPTYTDAQMARAERKYATAWASACNFDCDIDDLKLEMRTRLLAYGFLRGRAYGRMESNLNERTPRPNMNLIAQYTGSEFSVIKYWIDHPDSKPSGLNKAVFEAEAKIRDLKVKAMNAEAEARKIQDSASEYGRRLRSIQEQVSTYAKNEKDTQAKADEKAAEAKELKAQVLAAQAELKAAQDTTKVAA